jgi:hypothetical protein
MGQDRRLIDEDPDILGAKQDPGVEIRLDVCPRAILVKSDEAAGFGGAAGDARIAIGEGQRSSAGKCCQLGEASHRDSSYGSMSRCLLAGAVIRDAILVSGTSRAILPGVASCLQPRVVPDLLDVAGGAVEQDLRTVGRCLAPPRRWISRSPLFVSLSLSPCSRRVRRGERAGSCGLHRGEGHRAWVSGERCG